MKKERERFGLRHLVNRAVVETFHPSHWDPEKRAWWLRIPVKKRFRKAFSEERLLQREMFEIPPTG
jgi:hypothetical protein